MAFIFLTKHALSSYLARSVKVVLAVLAILAPFSPAGAQAQKWPSKPIKVIVGFAPGGAADQIARAITQPLQTILGQPVVVENKPGAGGNLAGDAVAKAVADGYTLLFSSGGTIVINPLIYTKMPFDATKDLQPVAAAARVSMYLEVNPNLPVNTIAEFLSYARAHPGVLSYGTPGNGSSPHLAGAMLQQIANITLLHVPYRGAAPAISDLLGGQINFMFDPGIGLQHVRSGKLKLLAIGSLQRSALFPEVPTLAESGLKDFDADTFFGFYAPAGMASAQIEQLNQAVNTVLASPAFKERMQAIGAEPAPMSTAQFSRRMQADSLRFAALVRAQGIRGN